MKNRYFDLIDQTFYFPSFDFNLDDDKLTFNDIPLMEVIEKFGTPLKITYLPKIGEQIQKVVPYADSLGAAWARGEYPSVR